MDSQIDLTMIFICPIIGSSTQAHVDFVVAYPKFSRGGLLERGLIRDGGQLNFLNLSIVNETFAV